MRLVRRIKIYKNEKEIKKFSDFGDCLEYLRILVDDCRPIVCGNELVFIAGRRCRDRYIVRGAGDKYKEFFDEK